MTVKITWHRIKGTAPKAEELEACINEHDVVFFYPVDLQRIGPESVSECISADHTFLPVGYRNHATGNNVYIAGAAGKDLEIVAQAMIEHLPLLGDRGVRTIPLLEKFLAAHRAGTLDELDNQSAEIKPVIPPTSLH